MNCDVLVSTMNKSDFFDFRKDMKFKNGIIINQITNKSELINLNEKDFKVFSYYEKGLSKSRNRAIDNSTADICVLADDDMYYLDDYIDSIFNSYKKYPDADIIAFVVMHDNRKSKKILKEGRINFFNLMKIQSVQVSFKRKSIIDKKIRFDEKFGAGTKYFCGEENIFLNDCRKKGLKIYYVPIVIARLRDTGVSSWFKGYDKQYFNTRGAIYYRISKILCIPLILQFAIRKYKLYKSDCGFFKSIYLMFEGIKLYKSELR